MPGLLVTASTDDTIKFWDIQVEKLVNVCFNDSIYILSGQQTCVSAKQGYAHGQFVTLICYKVPTPLKPVYTYEMFCMV